MTGKLMKVFLLAVCAFSLGACRARVGVGVGYGHDNRWHRGGYNQHDRYNRYDRFGRYEHFGQYGGQDRLNHHRRSGSRFNPSLGTVDQQSHALARDYNIRYDAAAKIITVINSENPKKDLAAMNLKAKDLSALTELEMPSQESIQKVAGALGESPEVVTALMEDFIADTSAEPID